MGVRPYIRGGRGDGSAGAYRVRGIAVFLLLACCLAAVLAAGCVSRPPEPFGTTPTPAQVAWQRMEVNMFCHFGPNTFSGAEWGSGAESESLFNPTHLDCRQWAATARAAGMGGIIVTAKHHDGFCLWPSSQSRHTVAQSAWRGGRGDVLRELRQACDSEGVAMGVYLSPWDRHDPAYGTPEYNDRFANTLAEVHSQYGPLFEQWFDGANGEGPDGRRQVYDWPRFMRTVDSLSPCCVVFSDVGPGCRWVGNEEGHADATCWSTLRTEGATPSDNKPAPAELATGHPDGSRWVPAECDVSIRPGWFWHPQEQPKTVDELVDIYFHSVGHNALMLLNVPPDTSGRIAAADSARLVEFRAALDRLFARDLAQGASAKARHRRGYAASRVLDTAYHTYWAATGNRAELTLHLDTVTEFDIIVLQEYIPLGQRVTMVNLVVDEGDGLYPVTNSDHPLCTTVGYKRIVRLDSPLRTRTLKLQFDALAPPVINRIALYNSAAQ